MRAGRAHRVVTALCVATLAVLVAPTGIAGATAAHRSTTASRSQEWGAAEEQAFVDKINALRSSLGLAPLAIDPELTAQARIWSQTMKEAGRIFHTSTLDQGISADWQKLGENVGVGGDVQSLFDAFVASPKHYENLVDPLYRYVGVGVVWDGNRMFTAHRFMALMPPAPPTTAAPAPRSAPAAAPVTTTTAPPDELASAEPVEPPAPAPTPPPATAQRIQLVLATIAGLDD